MEKKEGTNTFTIILIAVSVIVIIGIISYFLASIVSEEGFYMKSANVAVIKVEGPIYTTAAPSLFAPEMAVSEEIVQEIKDAEKRGMDAILLEINSPGGTVVASEEIVNAIKETNITTVAWIRELGASGGYWVASSADIVVADPMAITGSVGVLSSYLSFEGLMDQYGVKYERLTGGEYKDVGTPFKNLTQEERALMQERIDLIHDYFIQDVAESRNLNENQIKEISTGTFYLGIQAKEIGLVDELGGKDKAEEVLKEILKVEKVNLIEKREEPSLLKALTQVFYEGSFFVGKGMGQALLEREFENSKIMLI
jgi:protease-4